ncbi:MAG: hypothetical protein BWY59_01308 [Verrucomicrobia bacterium ADurb.Bin345]|nr:MAG: hypothetical protein BWY59_01308 [Verrucomicrobia bacterium ADurb.Bin345]
MADQLSENTNGMPPPKIKLNGNGHPETDSVQKPASAGGIQPPPKVRSQAQPDKQQTARIDFTRAVRPPAAPVKPGMPSDPKKSTSKIELPKGITAVPQADLDELSKRSTIRISSPSEMQPMTEEDKQQAVSKATVRIDLGSGMQPLTDEQKEEALKKSTVRIDTPADIQPVSEADKLELAKKTTARVIIDEDRAKGDTTRIEPATAEPSDAAKKRTARIDLGEMLDDEQDIFKRRTALIDSSKFAGSTEAPGAPRTIRIKRPETPPTTQMPRPPEPEPEEDVVVPVSQAEAARKSETARIDLPPEVAEQPPTRKKTIRIKRPGSSGAGSKPLVITRTPVDTGYTPGAKPKIVEEDSPAFAWIAIAAVLVSAVLIYVLASQVGTVAELIPARFPYPGSL